jgi:hypothetical protein
MTFPCIPGTCQFCGDKDEDEGGQIDGNRFSWLNGRRNCCTRSECTRAHAQKVKDNKATQARMNRRRTPAEIEELRKKERAAKRKRNPATLTARGLLKGDA